MLLRQVPQPNPADLTCKRLVEEETRKDGFYGQDFAHTTQNRRIQFSLLKEGNNRKAAVAIYSINGSLKEHWPVKDIKLNALKLKQHGGSSWHVSWESKAAS